MPYEQPHTLRSESGLLFSALPSLPTFPLSLSKQGQDSFSSMNTPPRRLCTCALIPSLGSTGKTSTGTARIGWRCIVSHRTFSQNSCLFRKTLAYHFGSGIDFLKCHILPILKGSETTVLAPRAKIRCCILGRSLSSPFCGSAHSSPFLPSSQIMNGTPVASKA